METTADYLEEIVEPCSSTQDVAINPCARTDDVAPVRMTLASQSTDGSPPSLQDIMTRIDAPEYAAHIVLRGTFQTESTHCAPALFLPVREIPEDLAPALNREDFRILYCFSDVIVHEYLVGKGPPEITVVSGGHTYWEAEYASRSQIQDSINFIQSLVSENVEGREKILFIGPSFTNSVEAWVAYNAWDVQQLDDGSIVAVAPHKEVWMQEDPANLPALEIPLVRFKSELAIAHSARTQDTQGRVSKETDAPPLITDAHLISDYFHEIGAYAHPSATPAPPESFK